MAAAAFAVMSVSAGAQAVAPASEATELQGQAVTTQPALQPVAPPALSAEAVALKAALERKFGRDSLALNAYANRAFKPIWLGEDGSPNEAARVLVTVLKSAGDHALPAAKYKGATLEARLTAGSPELEAELSAAFVEYAQDVGFGLLEPRGVDRELHIYPEPTDAGILIGQAAKATNMAGYLDTLPPSDPGYRRLVERFAAFRSLAASDIWGDPVRKGRTLRPGQQNARVAQARARLTAMGDLDPNVYDQQSGVATSDGTQIATNEVTTDVPLQAFDPNAFDEPMVEALQRFQARHGLNLDGVIGPATLKQLNISPRTRAEQIAVNLERLRWMNRDLGRKHILVNLAGFTMAVVNNGREEFTQRVVIGKADAERRTPEFSEMMTHMVINPSWYVPSSIANKELFPREAANPGYLAARGMRVRNGRIIQKPGPRNALGTVKFMFPNRWAIYLHDTPSRHLFKRDVRAYSHGCVRVERPHEFAAYLLAAQQSEPRAYFDGILKTRRERHVNLDEPLPVHLTYRSAWIDEKGVEQFRGDIYGRDRKIARALQTAGVVIAN
jgi:murein L,D-transpeptidase YcbB/YkuD